MFKALSLLLELSREFYITKMRFHKNFYTDLLILEMQRKKTRQTHENTAEVPNWFFWKLFYVNWLSPKLHSYVRIIFIGKHQLFKTV